MNPFDELNDARKGIKVEQMTKREIFAGQAMQTLISQPYYDGKGIDELCYDAILYADAMIEGLTKTEPGKKK